MLHCASPVLLDELRTFDFDAYPSHVRYLHCYAWKPILLEALYREFPNEVYLSVSILRCLFPTHNAKYWSLIRSYANLDRGFALFASSYCMVYTAKMHDAVDKLCAGARVARLGFGYELHGAVERHFARPRRVRGACNRSSGGAGALISLFHPFGLKNYFFGAFL